MSRRVTQERYAALRQSWWRHRDVMGLSRAAAGVYALGLSYCADDLTDGHIPRHVALKALADGKAVLCTELVDAKLWEATDTGYLVVGYLEHNASKADLETMAERKRAAGSKGGRTKAARVAVATPPATHEPECLRSKSLQDLRPKNFPPAPQGVDDESEREIPTLAERVDAQLAATATPGSTFRLLELLADLHSDPDGRPYLQPGMCSANDRKLLDGVIRRAAVTAEMHGIGVLEVVAGEWVALLSLAAAGETPERIGNVIAYFAKRFGEIQLARVESSVPEVPARQEAA